MTEEPVFFERCGACGSDKLVGQGLADEMIERGLVPDTFRFSLQEYQGLPLDQAAQDRMPIGSTIPGIQAVADACGECGTLRVVRYDRQNITKKEVAPKLARPLMVPPGPGDIRAN